VVYLQEKRGQRCQKGAQINRKVLQTHINGKIQTDSKETDANRGLFSSYFDANGLSIRITMRYVGFAGIPSKTEFYKTPACQLFCPKFLNSTNYM